MKIQLAIDRVSINEAINIIEKAGDYVDIIEVGTSLIKDFGLESIRKIKRRFPQSIILADIKTIDEAEYEFEAVYNAGADIATVMGAASLQTINICKKVANKYNRRYMIDLLETSEEKQKQLERFDDAIFCIHLPSDKNGEGLEALINATTENFNKSLMLSAAGGINYSNINIFKKFNFDILIIGSAISKADDIREAAKKFNMIVEEL